MQTKQTKLGTKSDFNRAIDEAFSGDGQKMSNPCIRYSDSRGFHVESNLVPSDSDVIWQGNCNYLMTGHPHARRSIRPSMFDSVMDRIEGERQFASI